MICSSFSFPNMFDVARSKVNLYADAKSITNRVKLLLLTEPTELYMNPDFGVGLKKYMFTYNNDNTIALIQDKLVEQLSKWEPCVVADKTKVTRGIDSPGFQSLSTAESEKNHLKLTVTLTTTYMQVVSFSIQADENGRII